MRTHTCTQHAHNMWSKQMCDWKSAPYFCSMAVVAACACPSARLVASFAPARRREMPRRTDPARLMEPDADEDEAASGVAAEVS